ncbi:DUF2334 domain-containing protein [Halobacillus locisalis]|uniref:DUF2334 domain-containing protein n=1 Tax=Halobacillus locisalis TaxID=220753 RepID=A0A838CU28_9BACI|nr:DUF2334 domain-containing protein [Halobacillus locisalis]MBA2175454.1 DUF2334 domain-containing protein [Halobacillus locisalis]
MRRLNQSNYRRLLIGIVIVISLFTSSHISALQSSTSEPLNLTVVFSSERQVLSEQQKRLDMLLSHFSSSITFTNVHKLKAKELSNTTHLIYFGEIRETLPNSFIKEFEAFNKTKMVIGHNHDQLPGFQFVKANGIANMTKLSIPSQSDAIELSGPEQLFDIRKSTYIRSWLTASNESNEFPVLIENNSQFYYADVHISLNDSILLGEVLHDIFKIPHNQVHPATLLLEDVNPMLDPSLLEECGEVLTKKEIPFMISVTPVYKNPSTGEMYHLSDSPDLVTVLQDLQTKGAAIILHGYTDQSGNGISGDGFEFGNTHQPSQMDARIERGVNELRRYGLEPIAFETPHYSISQNGYQAVAKHFSLYIGQLQLTDENWRIMSESPFITTPTFIEGMTLIPETLRYMEDDYDFSVSINQLNTRARNLTLARDSVMSAIYHPYLGVKGLEEMINEVESIQQIQWMNLQKLNPPTPLLNGHLKNPVKNNSEFFPISYFLLLSTKWSSLLIGLILGACMILSSYIISWKIRRSEKQSSFF